MSPAAYTLGGQPCTQEAFYAVACDPQRHVVVQACAGAGKTWMLVSRIVRALLDGAQPNEILAITFTKKAAGEMRQRLSEWLKDFSAMDDAQLLQELINRGISSEIAHQLGRNLRGVLSNLYQQTLLAPRTVQVRTFHSWFAQLLRGAPLAVLEQLGLPSPYELLEGDDEAIELVWPRFYTLLQSDEALHAVYRAAVADVGRASLEKALTHGLKKRVEFELADGAGVVARSIQPLSEAMPAFAHFDDPLQALPAQQDVLLRACGVLGLAKQKTYRDWGIELEAAVRNQQWEVALHALLRADGQPYALRWELAGKEHVAKAQDVVVEILAAQQHHAAWLHQQRMAQLMRALCGCFAQLKRQRGWVDMGDLERAALHLLQDGELSGWVQQRLDAQVRHVLMDEFQDTNPLQWQALQSWLSGYAGAGGGTAGRVPSIFIVGDAKQSIYRFRRAEPQVFEAATRFVCDGLQGSLLSCDHTRRNAPAVMQVVNAVMTEAARDSDYPFRTHTTQSDAQGSVLRLPLAPRPPKAAADAQLIWRDTLNEPRDEPDEKAVDAECALAARWVAGQVARGAEPKSFMVLARKRDRLARMRDALRQLGVPSQITEKSALIELPEVRDVVALLDALISPSNDLALAQVLKSPLFSCRDEQLAVLAQNAKAQHLAWFDLLSNQEHSAQYLSQLDADFVHKTSSDLLQCQVWLAQLPPHDALSAIYERLDVIARCCAAAPAPLRARVQGSLQALLAAALQASGGRFLTPHAWVRQLKSIHFKAPQTSASQAVSLMTVHGAKGLEAQTVLLLDCNSAPRKASTLDVLVDWPGEQSAPSTFAFLRNEQRVPQSLQAALAREQAQREREEINALYVAMTRARNQLVISGHEVSRPAEGNPWQRFEALGGSIEEAWHEDFASVAQPAGAQASQDIFLIQKLPLAGKNTAQNAPDLIAKELPFDAARIGICMHRLLELYRPGLDLAAIAPRIATSFNLNAEQARQAALAAYTITQGQAAWVWNEAVIDWQANEVELIHQGQLLRLDRLVKRADTQVWWVLDYKSNPAPQRIPELQAQLAQYRDAVLQANPNQTVVAAFITAQGALIQI